MTFFVWFLKRKKLTSNPFDFMFTIYAHAVDVYWHKKCYDVMSWKGLKLYAFLWTGRKDDLWSCKDFVKRKKS